MEWYEWFFAMAIGYCGLSAIFIAQGVYTIVRERGPNGEELRRRRLGR
jgi:hypothetical protein